MKSIPKIEPRNCRNCNKFLYHLQEKCSSCNSDIEWSYMAECNNCKNLINYMKDSCIYCSNNLKVWDVIIQEVLKKPPRKNIRIIKRHKYHPENQGFNPIKGEPKSYLKDYEKSLPNNRRAHILEFKNYYLIHWDERNPNKYQTGNIITMFNY